MVITYGIYTFDQVAPLGGLRPEQARGKHATAIVSPFFIIACHFTYLMSFTTRAQASYSSCSSRLTSIPFNAC